MSKISFMSHGFRLAGNFFAPPEAAKKLTFLLIQGWTGHQNLDAAKALAGRGYPALTYDMRGNGESEGDIADFSRADFVADAVVAYDFLKRQMEDGTVIGVIGSSFGSYTAVVLSKERPIACLSLRVPASYPDEGYDEPQAAQGDADNMMRWRAQALDYSQNHAFQALHDFSGPVQIIEAGADELVPAQSPKNYGAAIADQTKLTYEVMPDAPHRLISPALQADYEKRLLAWVKALEDDKASV